MYDAQVFEVFIASPSDTKTERDYAVEIINDWNTQHTRKEQITLQPLTWERNVYSDFSGPPQEIINKQILENADVLVAIFRGKIGSPTKSFESGTVEEFKTHIGSGKHAMAFFSSADISNEEIDAEQKNALLEFKKWCSGNGLYVEYKQPEDFKEKFRNQLSLFANSLKKTHGGNESISLTSKNDDYEEKNNIKELLQITNDGNALSENNLLINDIISKSGNNFEAIDYLVKMTSTLNNDKNKYEVYKTIYNLTKDENKYLANIAISKAIDCFPNQMEDLFDAAYNSDDNLYSLFYYSRLLELDGNHIDGLNNLGVTYERLKMNINSVNYYRKSVELGNTLAMANLANRYLKAGFDENAKSILDTALTKTDPDKNVYLNLLLIATDKKNEDEKKQKLLKITKKYVTFINNHTNSFLTRYSPGELIGVYKTTTGEKLEITNPGNNLLTIAYTSGNDFYAGIKNTDYLGFEIKIESGKEFYKQTLVCTLAYCNNKIALLVRKDECDVKELLFHKNVS
jgi:hypothetical protein